MPNPTPPPLELSPEDMRALGYRTIDAIVDHITGLPSSSPGGPAHSPDFADLLPTAPPEVGADPSQILERTIGDVLRDKMHPDHPRFFAFVPGPNNYIGVLADALAAGFTVFAGTWLEAPTGTQIERTVIDWLRQECGLPDTAGGLCVSGGSVANLTALAVARQHVLGEQFQDGVVYCSDQTHSSVDRALRVLGIAPQRIRRLQSDDQFRLPAGTLVQMVAEDRAHGLRPFCIVANAGTTNTGAIDPLNDLADICEREGMWLHADGAYGAAAMICASGKRLLAGLERADSLSIDPHKWLFQPYEIGCVLLREKQLLFDTYHILPEYLKDIEAGEDEMNFCDHGIQLTRSFRALKLWMSITTFGMQAFRTGVERGFYLAQLAEEVIATMPDWEVTSPAQLSVVTFRYAPSHTSEEERNAMNRAVVPKITADGFALIMSTELRGKTVLRLCTVNPRTTDADIRETLSRLDRLMRTT